MRYYLCFLLLTTNIAVSFNNQKILTDKLLSVERVMIITYDIVNDEILKTFGIDNSPHLIILSLTNGENRNQVFPLRCRLLARWIGSGQLLCRG